MRRRRDALLGFRVTASCVVIAAVRRAKRLASLSPSLPRGQCQVSRRSELTVAQRSQSHLRKDWRLVHKDTAIRQLILVFFISSSSRNLLRNRTGKFFKLVPRRRPFPRPLRDIFGNIINLSCAASPSSSSGRSLESPLCTYTVYVPVQCIVCPKKNNYFCRSTGNLTQNGHGIYELQQLEDEFTCVPMNIGE